MFLGSALAAGGGLGGGGIFVPVLILVLSLSPKEAVPISQAMIFGGSLVNLVMNYRSRHPVVKTRPLIDYDAVLILEPLMLLGTTFGVMLNAVSPTWLIIVSFFFFFMRCHLPIIIVDDVAVLRIFFFYF